MQDGAPPHFSCSVTDVLNERFPDVWIGRGGPIPWPTRRPDLSPLDFFLWGTLTFRRLTSTTVDVPHR